jgi:hypothetical protein
MVRAARADGDQDQTKASAWQQADCGHRGHDSEATARLAGLHYDPFANL